MKILKGRIIGDMFVSDLQLHNWKLSPSAMIMLPVPAKNDIELFHFFSEKMNNEEENFSVNGFLL